MPSGRCVKTTSICSIGSKSTRVRGACRLTIIKNFTPHPIYIVSKSTRVRGACRRSVRRHHVTRRILRSKSTRVRGACRQEGQPDSRRRSFAEGLNQLEYAVRAVLLHHIIKMTSVSRLNQLEYAVRAVVLGLTTFMTQYCLNQLEYAVRAVLEVRWGSGAGGV